MSDWWSRASFFPPFMDNLWTTPSRTNRKKRKVSAAFSEGHQAEIFDSIRQPTSEAGDCAKEQYLPATTYTIPHPVSDQPSQRGIDRVTRGRSKSKRRNGTSKIDSSTPATPSANTASRLSRSTYSPQDYTFINLQQPTDANHHTYHGDGTHTNSPTSSDHVLPSPSPSELRRASTSPNGQQTQTLPSSSPIANTFPPKNPSLDPEPSDRLNKLERQVQAQNNMLHRLRATNQTLLERMSSFETELDRLHGLELSVARLEVLEKDIKGLKERRG